MDEKNGHYFADIDACNDDGDWIEYGDNLRVKKISSHLFAATEIVKNTFGGYFCLLHLVKLSDYTEDQISEFEENYPEYKDVFNDEEFYAAACIASVLGVEGAHLQDTLLYQSIPYTRNANEQLSARPAVEIQKAKKIKQKKINKLRYAEYYDQQELLDSLYRDSQNGAIFDKLMKHIVSDANILMAYKI